MECRVCKTSLKPFFSLGKMPLVNSFLKKTDLGKEEKFDLTVGFCVKCYMVQLMQTVPPTKLFSDYVYFSSTSKSFVQYCKKTAAYLKKRFKLNSKSIVLEVASNDGVLLQFLKELGIQILGVDPAKNVAAVANNRGLETIVGFFNLRFAKKLLKTRKFRADIIYGANVLAHVGEIVDFLRGVKVVLKASGTAVFEFPYLAGLLENKFDTIYHEHVFYYSLTSLVTLFKKAELEIYDVEITKVQGRSLRIFAGHKGIFKTSASVRKLKAEELGWHVDDINTYYGVAQNVSNLKKELITLLQKLKSEKKTIAAYSAPAKGNILLNYFDIDKNYLKFIVDKSTAKQGLYTPGTHLRVQNPNIIEQENPDYLLILCWNILDEVKKQLKSYLDSGGKFIIPVPRVKIYASNKN